MLTIGLEPITWKVQILSLPCLPVSPSELLFCLPLKSRFLKIHCCATYLLLLHAKQHYLRSAQAMEQLLPILCYALRAKQSLCTRSKRSCQRSTQVGDATSCVCFFLLQEIQMQPTLSLFATLDLKVVALHVLLKGCVALLRAKQVDRALHQLVAFALLIASLCYLRLEARKKRV